MVETTLRRTEPAPIRLDEGNRVTVDTHRQQVILRFRLGSSTLVDMAITKDGARKLAEELMSACQ